MSLWSSQVIMETRPVIVDRNGQTRLTLNCHGNKVDWEIPRAALVYPEGPSGHEYVNGSISLESHLTEVIHTKVMRSPSAWNPKSTACLKGSHTSLSFSLNYVSQVYLDPLSWSLCLSLSLSPLILFPHSLERELYSKGNCSAFWVPLCVL